MFIMLKTEGCILKERQIGAVHDWSLWMLTVTLITDILSEARRGAKGTQLNPISLDQDKAWPASPKEDLNYISFTQTREHN